MAKGESRPGDLAVALEEALEAMRRADTAASRGKWKSALGACERVARVARLHGHERLLASVLAQAVLALMPLAAVSPQRVRRLLELLDESVEAQPHDIDLAYALHDSLTALLANIEAQAALPERKRHALARLGLTYARPLCARFPMVKAFATTHARLRDLMAQ